LVFSQSTEAVFLDRFDCQSRHVDLDQPVAVEAVIVEGAFRVTRLGQVPVRERAAIGNHDPAGFHIRQIGDQGGRVHRDQNVELIARGHDLASAEIDLECRHAECGACRGANLCREIREGRKIVPFNRCRHGEMTAGELHSIAGVACKTDNCGFDFLPVLVRMIDGRYFRHRVFPSR